MSVNKVILLGNVGNEPEIKTTRNGHEVAKFSLATSESYKDKQGNRQQKTEWHKIAIFGSLISIIKNYVHKGSKLYIEGSLKTIQWTDNQGIERYSTEIILSGFNSVLKLLDSKNNNNPNQSSQNSSLQKEEEFLEGAFID